MIVWLLLLLLAVAIVVILWRVARLDRPTLQIIGSGLCIALAGYLWQGLPSLAGKPAAATAPEIDQTRVGGETFAALRKIVLDQFDRASYWLTLSDRYLSEGDSLSAAQILGSAIRAHPRDSDLWVGLGNALFLHADATVTPAVDFAFDRAQQLAPRNPAPLFFRGMAYAQAGDFGRAEAAWRQTLAQLPANASWRPLVEERLALLIQLQAMQQEAMRSRGAPAS